MTSVSGSRVRQVSAREFWRVSFDTTAGSTFVFTSSADVSLAYAGATAFGSDEGNVEGRREVFGGG